MKTIGRILACVLLATVFAKNVLARNAGNIEFAKGRSDGNNDQMRANATELQLRSSPDADDSSNILDGTFKTDKSDRGLMQLRTFGMKRVQFMLMPLMYKMGVMMTILVVLTVISLKGLFIGITLLVLKISTFLAKLYSWPHHADAHTWSPQQPVHVHLHNSSPYSHAQPNTWEASAPAMDEQHYYYNKG